MKSPIFWRQGFVSILFLQKSFYRNSSEDVWSFQDGLNFKPAVPWIRPVRIQVERGRPLDYIVEIKIPLGI